MPNRSLAPSTALLTITTVIGLAGCSGALNQENGLLGEDLPDLSGRMPVAVPQGEVRGFERVDRATWDHTTIVVQQRQIETYPNYSPLFTLDDTTARQRGEAPTQLTALEDQGDPGTLAFEGVAAPFVAAFDLVVSPVRMVMRPPWTTVRAPEQPTPLVESVPMTGPR